MTPTAATPAARKRAKPAASDRAGGSVAQRSAGHKRSTRPASPPRRVSGPAGGVTRPRPASAPARPARRVSGPTPRKRGGTRSAHPLAARLGRFVRRLPDHSLLDQIVRGRAWIPLLGILLAGIVAMQVEVLKLSANMGRALERGTALQSRNEQLRASVAQLGDDQRIERIAAQMGMVMPPPTAVKFLAPRPAGQIGRALAGIQTPNPTAFAAALPGAAATPSTSTSTATAGTTAPVPVTPTPVAPVTSAATTPGVPSSTTPTATTPPGTTSAATPSATYTPPTTYTPTTTSSSGSSAGAAGGAAAAGAVTPGSGG